MVSVASENPSARDQLGGAVLHLVQAKTTFRIVHRHGVVIVNGDLEAEPLDALLCRNAEGGDGLTVRRAEDLAFHNCEVLQDDFQILRTRVDLEG